MGCPCETCDCLDATDAEGAPLDVDGDGVGEALIDFACSLTEAYDGVVDALACAFALVEALSE